VKKTIPIGHRMDDGSLVRPGRDVGCTSKTHAPSRV
jgi:hypothetical protein